MAAVQHEFAPPAPRGLLPALVLALLAHALLALVLSVGVHWRRSAPVVAAEAELWAAVPQAAAPAAEPEPEPEPQPTTAPLPPQPVPVQPPKDTTPPPDIVLEKEKQRQRQAELDKAQREKERLAKLEQEKRERERLEKDKQAKLAQDKARTDKDRLAKLDAAKKEKEEARRLEEMRQQNLKRLAGLAASGGGTGDAKASGTAAQSAGPSAGYAGRIVARVRPNIVFTETLSSNPVARVEVHTAPDGTILMSRTRIVQSSGVRTWDEAVLKALEKTEVLPKDVDGRIPSPMEISFRPKN
ncbi:MAG: cell envelope integrity protein TolA [Rhodoferax sp.]